MSFPIHNLLEQDEYKSDKHSVCSVIDEVRKKLVSFSPYMHATAHGSRLGSIILELGERKNLVNKSGVTDSHINYLKRTADYLKELGL